MPSSLVRTALLLMNVSYVCCTLSCKPASTPMPSSSATSQTVSGIDVSRYQGTIDWEKVQESGITFAIAKATQGKGYTDPTFSKNWSDIRRVGIIRGAYHYLTPDIPGDKQARHFLSVVKLKSGDLPPIVDVERIGKHSNEHLLHTLLAFHDQVLKDTGHQIMIYVSPAFWNDHLLPRLTVNLPNPLWIAEYDVEEPQELTNISPWSIWQYSKTGTCEGITGHVDLNRARNIQSIRIP